MMEQKTTGFYIEIRPFTEDETDGGFVRIHASSRRNAEKIERGANINLNHAKYYTRIVDLTNLAQVTALDAARGKS